MSNKIVKVISVVLMLMVIVSIALPVFAGGLLDTNITGTQSDASNQVGDIAGQILGIVQVIGVAVAVIMLVVLAIKYVSSAAADKAEIKKHAVVYIIGAICLFGAAGILQLIKTFAGQI